VLPQTGFLAGLRELTERHGAVLIFDEVMTGFRVGPGGVQEREGISPDLTTLGKIIGGGLPVGAFGGRSDIMSRLSPEGPVYQAGTLSGNPLAMAAGLATLRGLQAPGTYAHLHALGTRFTQGMSALFTRRGVPHVAANRGSMVGFFFTAGPVHNLTDAKTSDTALYARFFHGMLDRGHYLAPSQFEAGFLSTAHREEDVDRTLAAAAEALDEALTAGGA
jgi:glutamate-1-semialdehyde 2,1-aminomutase